MPLANGLSFANIFDASANATALFDRELRFVGANTAFLRLTGLAWARIEGVRLFDALALPDEASIRKSLESVLATGERSEMPFARYANDRIVSISTSAVPDEHGTQRWLLHHIADITEARKIELHSSQIQAEYRELIEIAPQQVWTATPGGLLDSVNQQTVAYFGKPHDTIIGDGWQAVIHPEDLPETIEAWTHSLATGETYQRYFRLRSAAGEYRWHLARATSVRGDDGNVFAWIGTNTDVHDARVAHDELLQRAAYEEKLIGVVSHDLRNPLATIVLALSVLDGVDLPPEAGRALNHVRKATTQAEHLITDLMDFAQARSGNFPIAPTPSNITSLIKPAVEAAVLLAGKRDVVIEHHGPQIGAWDEGRLIQVLGNLIGNAFQHAPANAAIRVTSRIDGDRTTIDVFNDGTAIADEDRARLFDPFARGRNARTKRGRSIGLGLYIAQQITRAHGGEITVDSAPGRGTTFTVALPTRVPT